MQHYESIFFDNPKLKRLAEETYDLPLSKIANSIWLSNQIKEKHGFEPPIVNPAINHNKFYPRDLKGPSYRRRILCYGRRDKWKGFKDAIDAMRIVFKKIQDVEWIVYGFKYLPKSFDVPYTHVGFLNHEELAKLYSSVDAFFLPSWFESFPLQPLEAMACGTPVITTRFGTEDYAFDGVNAVVVPPKNPKALAAAIIRLLDDKDLREKLSKEGLNTAKKFTWNRTVDQVEELFKNALK
jgi:glycosyltransferase involved in cell wall biosynthesis